MRADVGSSAVKRWPMLPGDWGTAQTIAKIRELVAKGKRSIDINRLAISIVWSTPNFSEADKALAIYQWVQRNTRFIPMVVNAQTLRTAQEILRVRAGDCANLNAILLPSLLETIGIPCRLVTIAGDPADKHEFTHVYCEAYVDGNWIALDVARPGAQFGRAPETYFRKRYWDLESRRYLDAKAASRLNGYTVSRGGIGQVSLAIPGQTPDSFTSDVASLTSGAANVIDSLRASPSNIVGQSSPYASTVGSAPAISAFSSSVLGIPVWGWGIGLLVVVAMAARGKR